ncbi:cytochrome c oxidase assembly protein subunit 15 [Filomicrobium insigne]|uniref:Heme A synthase n=1 Tax=Filomicrobium insigne TaxID=418854 RepID=A0A1H0QKU6_9HYPH|nr:COX15/CtaA family protein [Filomicrobium insigne]SDP17695.1 cytochrome c oxidase assembly protein subunit 15 [Filomicrobium insigne]
MTQRSALSNIGARPAHEAIPASDRAVRLWLIVVALLVFAMIVVGGATRLTDSGLSITEWLPLLGAIPPLNDADWADAFAKYQQIPQYELLNHGMSLAEFKFIYWWEWSHRFLGRFIGVVFALPLIFFWLTGRLRPVLVPKLWGLLALGALQGFFGWYMVQSGLVERIDVSHYRLALHLTTALVILALLTWLVLDLSTLGDTDRIRLQTVTSGQRRLAYTMGALLLVQVIIGAFVAGMNAGLTYNTWPLMDGRLIPNGLGTLSPWYMNVVENVTTVQFIHRTLAYLLLVLAGYQAIRLALSEDDERIIASSRLFVIALLCQAGLGIWTLLEAGVAGHIPISLGLLHQAGAAIVVVACVWHLHNMTRTNAQ